MSRKFKLFFSLASLCFSVAMLCFGVYSAMSVSYSVSGSVSYEVQDVFVDINTSLYVSTDTTLTDQGKLNSNVASFESGQVASGTEKITSYIDSLSTYNLETGEVTNPGTTLSKTSPNIPINYGSYESQTKGYAYYIVVEITNYGTEDVSVTVTNNINTTAINSLTQVSNSTTISAKSGESDYAKKYIVIGLALADATKSVDNETFDVSILIERDVELEPTLDKLSFTLSGESYTVSAKDKSISGTVVIPSTYNGLPVTTINSFQDCNLTKLVIPDSVVTIYYYTFSNSNIPIVKYHIQTSSYIFDDGTLTIGNVQNNALGVDLYDWRPDPGEEPEHYPTWYNLNPLVDKVIILDSVTALEDRSFEYCYKLKSATIPSSVTSIGKEAFAYCTSLTEVTIPSGVTSIGEHAFDYCTSLTEVTIQNGVTSIGELAFMDCTSLTSINVDEGNQSYSSKDGVLYNKEKSTLIQYPFGNLRESYEIPNGVTSIGNYAFRDCTSLTEVTIPSTVTSIGNYAFNRCTGLASINVDEGNQNYSSKDGALFNKERSTLIQYPIGNLRKSYEIPNGVTSIETYAFEDCTNLTEVTIPGSVTSIGELAFFRCLDLNTVYIDSQDVVTTLTSSYSAEYLIYYLQSGTGCVYINKNITSIPSNYLNSTNFDIATEAVNGYICYRKK